MATEIEAKLKVDSHEALVEKLKAASAQFLSQLTQRDHYFDNHDRSLVASDKCLRLRHQNNEGNDRTILTYKGPKQKDDFKKRTEIELEITDPASAAQLLEALGYDQGLVFEKRRSLWKLGGCEVALDELPLLGTFVEIEGPDAEKITEVQQTLGLKNSPHITDSYACMMEMELSRIGDQQHEAFFE